MGADRRLDLAAMFASIARSLGEAEEPLLAANSLSMWEYIVLSQLARGPMPNQLTLAREIRHDKTRLIRLLDSLQHRGLIERTPDPADRRSHTLTLTDAGRQVQQRTRGAIREMEDEVLMALTAAEQRALHTALPKLYEPRRWPGSG